MIDVKYVLSFCLVVLISSNSLKAQVVYSDQAGTMGVSEACGTTYLGNGVSFADFDQDGWDDITICTESGQPVRFFKNNNGANFQEMFFNINDPSYQTKQTNWVDYDNDGDKDLFVTSDTSGNRLYQNDGTFNFTDVTSMSNLPTTNLYTYGASWGDINNDSFLDVFISNRNISNTDSSNKLYRNNGDGTFTDISISAGIFQPDDLSFCSGFFDFNNDGYQDIYVANDKPQFLNVLYQNNGDETFTEVGAASGTNIGIDAMSVTIDDFNHDGWFDMYITNGPAGNVFFRNNGNGTFTDIAQTSGTTFNSIGWGAIFLDAENDMDLDLYVSSSLDGSVPGLMSSAFYENLGNENFNLANLDVGLTGTDNRSSFSNAIGDVNNDGLPDILVTNDLGDNLYLWVASPRNDNDINNWLKVKLRGTVSNRDGIGSVIEVSVNGNKQYRYTLCGEGYLAQNSSTEIFGLSNNTMVDYVKVTWLSGITDTIYNVNVNQVLEIEEGSEVLSTSENSESFFRAYPNPVKDKFTIESFNKIHAVEIFNAQGQKLMDVFPQTLRIELDLSTLRTGTYFCKLKQEESVGIIKLIKL